MTAPTARASAYALTYHQGRNYAGVFINRAYDGLWRHASSKHLWFKDRVSAYKIKYGYRFNHGAGTVVVWRTSYPFRGPLERKIMKRFWTITTALVATFALVATVAFAFHPVKGGSYEGHFNKQSTTITFTVSSNGEWVRGLRLRTYVPNDCGSGGPPPAEFSAPASISNGGKFTAHLRQYVGNGHYSHATVWGTFLAHGKEKGTINYKPRPGEPAKCGGWLSYTAHVVR